MLIEAQVVRSKSELLKELQTIPVTRAVNNLNVHRKAWEQIAEEHQRLITIMITNNLRSEIIFRM